MQNLKNSFPHKSATEIKVISEQYYKNLMDIILETIKIERIDPNDISHLISIKNPEILNEYYINNQNVIIASGHIGNWEWYGLTPFLIKHQALVAVKPLSNKSFEKYLTNLRHHFGGLTVDYKSVFSFLYKNKKRCYASLFAADQSPSKYERNYQKTFLNQNTFFYLGIEKIAKALDQPVIYSEMTRITRSKYEIEFKLITDKPKECDEHTIINKYICYLEESIRKQPDNWLWSHRRWKNN